MKARRPVWLMVAALAVPVAGADDKASPLSTLVPGDRVRVEVLGNRETLTATIESVTADELVLKSMGAAQPLRLSLGQLDQVDVARGSRTQWRKGAVIGLIPGAVLGGLLGVAFACDPDVAGCESGFTLGAGLVGGVIGGTATATIGALVGLAFRTDRWVTVHQGKAQASLTLAPTAGGVRAGLTVSF